MKPSIFLTILFMAVLLWSCSNIKENQTVNLESAWKFRKAGDAEWLPAKVPGCVHTDLIDHQKIADPFFRKNELDVKWIETTDWEYETTFTLSNEIAAASNINLQFDGLDTYADVYLNDSLVLEADNMFIAWTVQAKKYLKPGENKLRIYIHSAVNVGMEKLKKVPYLIMAANEIAPENERSNVFTRKAPFHYGWDWGPRLVTCGVWKPVKIVAWNELIMKDLYLKPVDVSVEKATYKAIAEITTEKESKLNLEVWVDNAKIAAKETQVIAGTNPVELDFAIDKPELWWTNGLGGHKLYNIQLRVVQGGKTVQTLADRIGVRTIELVRDKDSLGNNFYFRLNGVPVFMKGANYIPSDIFTTRNTQANYQRVVGDAVNANMNMIRVWGGAIYENNAFYDLLDENGLLAWNDFMFACNMQPNDSVHLQNIRKEAEYNVKRLRNHPSIALWCGNNENLRAWNDWGWPKKVKPEQATELWSVYEKIFYQILPEAVKKYHPEITYWPSSPQAENNQNSNPTSGDEHDWRVWFGDVPFSTYSEKVCRFISEYGLQSFPEMKTVRAFASDSDLAYRSPVMEHRQRSQMPWIAPGFNGNEMINTYIKRYYKPAKDFESFVYLSQVMQAEGVKFAIETHRRNMPHCMGSLFWQINDCWPTMSWASVDYFGRWKALHYTVKNAFQPVYPIIFRKNRLINILVASDKLNAKEVVVEARLLDFNGKELWKSDWKGSIDANASKVYMQIPEKDLLTAGSAAKSVLAVVVKSAGTILSENMFYLKDCKELQLEKPLITKSVSKINDSESEITLATDKLAKNVMLFAPKKEGHFSDNNFDMLPGKTYKIKVTCKAEILETDLLLMTVVDTYIK